MRICDRRPEDKVKCGDGRERNLQEKGQFKYFGYTVSNHRWIVGGKLCLLLNQWGLIVEWDCATCRPRILTASAENLDPSILRGHILYEKSGREGYKPLRRRLRRAGLRSGWGAVDCVGSDHSMSS